MLPLERSHPYYLDSIKFGIRDWSQGLLVKKVNTLKEKLDLEVGQLNGGVPYVDRGEARPMTVGSQGEDGRVGGQDRPFVQVNHKAKSEGDFTQCCEGTSSRGLGSKEVPEQHSSKEP